MLGVVVEIGEGKQTTDGMVVPSRENPVLRLPTPLTGKSNC